MPQLNIDLPKTQEGIDELATNYRCFSCVLILFLIAEVLIFSLFIEASPSESLTYNLLWSLAIAAMLTSPFAQGWLTPSPEIILIKDKLSANALLEYESLCKKHPELAKYNATLERPPVLKELKAFREYDKASELEEIENRVRNTGAENGK